MKTRAGKFRPMPGYVLVRVGSLLAGNFCMAMRRLTSCCSTLAITQNLRRVNHDSGASLFVGVSASGCSTFMVSVLFYSSSVNRRALYNISCS